MGGGEAKTDVAAYDEVGVYGELGYPNGAGWAMAGGLVGGWFVDGLAGEWRWAEDRREDQIRCRSAEKGAL
jgi:hypothetical protein